MLHKLSLLAAGTMLGLAAMSFSGGAAVAAGMPLSSPAATQSNVVDGIIQVAERRDRRLRSSWDSRRDGRRCSTRFGNCRHYHRGHYYQTPWWTLPLIIGGSFAANNYYDDGGGYGNRHVEWCLDRYRSYNPRTNTWVAYSGNVNQCNSPYG